MSVLTRAGIGDWGSGIGSESPLGDAKTLIPNPQSLIPDRRAMTASPEGEK